MECPACEIDELKTVQLGPIGVNGRLCKNCHGLWLPPDQFREAIENADSLSLYGSHPSFELHCLNCGALLQELKLPYSTDLTVGICKKCRGIWVNGTDLRKFVQTMSKIQDSGIPEGHKRRKGIFKRVLGCLFP